MVQELSQNNGVGCNHAQCYFLFFARRTEQHWKYEFQYFTLSLAPPYITLLTEVCTICRDNAVYRSNSFKFERKSPALSDSQARESSHISNIIDQVIQTKKRNRIVRTKKEVILLRSILKVTACNCMDFLITSAVPTGLVYWRTNVMLELR